MWAAALAVTFAYAPGTWGAEALVPSISVQHEMDITRSPFPSVELSGLKQAVNGNDQEFAAGAAST